MAEVKHGIENLNKKKCQALTKAEPVPEICGEFELVESDAEIVPNLDESSDEEGVVKSEIFEVPEEIHPEDDSETISKWLEKVVENQKKHGSKPLPRVRSDQKTIEPTP